MFPVGLSMMLTEFGKQYLWSTAIFLGLQSLILFLVHRLLAGPKAAVSGIVLIFILSLGIEYIGVNTAFPFGVYSYPDILMPKLFGVPIAISFAWYSVTLSSLLVTKMFTSRTGAGAIVTAFITAIIILALDLLLEPFASFVNGFWLWNMNKVPFANFFSWFVIGFLFSLLIEKLSGWDTELLQYRKLFAAPLIILIINVLDFSFINIYHGYLLFTLSGIGVLAAQFFLIITSKKIEA